MMEELKALLPGIFGAALAAALPPPRPLFDRLIGFLVGFGFALYITEPVMDFYKLTASTYGPGLGFVLGFFGMTAADKVLNIIRNTDWMSIFRSKGGG